MTTKNYIKIPTITSLKVSNYPLFNYLDGDHWSFQMLDGINLIFGANSIGKTTILNMIKFAFIGEDMGKFDANYFTRRVKKYRRTSNEKIILEFTLNDKSVEIHRNIYSGELNDFFIDDEDVGDKKQIKYQKFLEAQSQMSLGKFKDLLELMLIRIEEGNYILWEEDAQTKVISALLNDSQFQKEFLEDEEKALKYDDECKKIYSLIKNKNKLAKDLKERKDAEKKKRDEKSVIDIREELNNYQQEKTLIDKKIAKLQKKLDAKKIPSIDFHTHAESTKSKYKTVQFQIEHVELEIRLLKNKITNSSIEKKCILCKTTDITKEKATQIHKQYFTDRICPVCEISMGASIEEENPIIIQQNLQIKQSELTKLKKELSRVKKEFEKAERAKNGNQKSINSFRREIDIEGEKLRKIKLNILNAEHEIDIFKKKNINEAATTYDVPLNVIIDEIRELEQKYTVKMQEKKRHNDKVIEQRRKRNKIIKDFYTKLNKIFKKYSKQYFEENCELTYYIPSSNGIDRITNFAPKFKGEDRMEKDSVSHSEAIFLEYLFRVSLLELYCSEAKTKPFLFLETSEGAFDIVHTESAADLFSKFARGLFPVILVSNKSKKDFISKLFSKESDKKKRMFNLIPYGKLNEKHAIQLKLAPDW